MKRLVADSYLASLTKGLDEMSAIVQSIYASDAATVAKLLSEGESPDAIDASTGESALSLAAGLGVVGCVEAMLEFGADPNFPDTTAWPLSNAAGQGHAQVVELLLSAGAEVDATDEEGGTAIIDAAAGGYLSIVEQLVQAGADLQQRDHQQKQAADYAAEKGHAKVVEFLSANSTANSSIGASPGRGAPQRDALCEEALELMAAAHAGDLDAVESILATGGDVNAATSEGITPAFIAAVEGHLDVLKVLVESGADVNCVSSDGDCALDFAAKNGQGVTFDYLLPLTSDRLRESAEWLKANKILRGEWQRPRPDIDEKYSKQTISKRVLQEFFYYAKSASFPEAEAELHKHLDQDALPADLILSDGTTLLMCAAESGNLDLVAVPK